MAAIPKLSLKMDDDIDNENEDHNEKDLSQSPAAKRSRLDEPEKENDDSSNVKKHQITVDTEDKTAGTIFSRQWTPHGPGKKFEIKKKEQPTLDAMAEDEASHSEQHHIELQQVNVDDEKAQEDSASGSGVAVHHLVTQVKQDDPKKGFWQSVCSCFFSKAVTTDMDQHADARATALAAKKSEEAIQGQEEMVVDEDDLDISADIPEGYLDPLPPSDRKKKTLVLDLDETLVHSSFRPVAGADFILKIEIENNFYEVYVLKRPGVDEFLKKVAEKFEIVIFTASLPQYANPLLDKLDVDHVITGRLFREHCVRQGPIYIKDLSKLGRSSKRMILVDNSPNSYVFQPEASVPILSWFEDQQDRELDELVPVLDMLNDFEDVTKHLDANAKWKDVVKKITKDHDEEFPQEKQEE